MNLSILLAASLAAPASAHPWPDCLHSGPKKAPVESFAELRACQKKVARRAEEDAETQGKPLSDAERDSLAEHQHEEARTFMARSNAVVEGPTVGGSAKDGGGPQKAAGGTEKVGAGNGPGSNDGAKHRGRNDDVPPEMRAGAAHIMARVKAAGLKKLPDDAVERLKAALQSNGGRVTAEIDRMIDDEIAAARSSGS